MSLTLTTVAIGVLISLHDCLVRDPEDVFPRSAIALGARQHLVMSGSRCYSSFYSRHNLLFLLPTLTTGVNDQIEFGVVVLGVRKHLTDCRLICGGYEQAFAKLTLTLCGLLSQDMVQEGLRPLELAFRCAAKTLCGAPVSLEFWHGLIPIVLVIVYKLSLIHI